LIVLLAIALLSTFVALVLTSLLPSPAWRIALDATAFCAATAVLAAAGAVLDRVRLPDRVRPAALPVVSALAALGSRPWLLDWLVPPEALPRIDYLRLQLAALSVAASLIALLGSMAVLCRAGSWPVVGVAAVSITVALYCIGPVLLRAGIPLDVRTFLGLAGIGVGAYALVEGVRRVGRGHKR
jgi:hypothetical protein